MADNFNLRSFLTENKLTKNAKLLGEGAESPKVSRLGWKSLEQNTDPVIKKMLADYEVSAAADYDEMDRDQGMMQQYTHTSDPRSDKTIKILQQLVALAGEKGIDLHPEAPPAKPEEEAKELGFWDKVKSKVGLKEGSDYGYEALMDVVDNEYDGDPAIAAAVEDAFHSGDIDTSEFGDDLNAPSRAVAQIANGHDIESAQQSMGFEEEVTMKETKLTAKERRLVEMVNNAMGMQEEENVDYTMGRQDDPNQLSNPAPELNIPEGDEMADETIIPEYRTIDELMKSIDHGTNKVAEEHKMQEMKKIAEALRMKAKKMEESEHAAHISPKDLKQLATDAAKLEKAAEKLKAAFDKKFNKKEKPTAAPKAEKVEALAEGTFDLRKFLAENRK